MGVWVWGSGCGGLGVGVWVWGSGCGGLGVGVWVWGSGCGGLGVGVWVWGSGCGGLGVGVWVWGSGCGGLGTVTWKCLYLSVVVVLPSSFLSFSGRNSLTKYNLLQHVYHIWCALGTTSETFLTQGKVCFGWLYVAI